MTKNKVKNMMKNTVCWWGGGYEEKLREKYAEKKIGKIYEEK